MTVTWITKAVQFIEILLKLINTLEIKTRIMCCDNYIADVTSVSSASQTSMQSQ